MYGSTAPVQILRQSDTEKIDTIMTNQRNALELLNKIADCLQTECDSWTSNMEAMLKAAQMEEKAKAAAEKKSQKAEQRAAQRMEKKQAAAAAREAKNVTHQ